MPLYAACFPEVRPNQSEDDQLKRYSSKIFNDFKKLADSESRQFNDATIEMDLLIKKANGLSAGMRESIADIENRIKGLDIEKSSLKKVEDDLKVISQAAREVNNQIEFIAASRSSFGDMAKKINSLTENLVKIDRDTALIIQAFNEKVRDRSRELGEEIAQQINRLKDSIHDRENNILSSSYEKIEMLTRTFSDSLTRMEQGITTTGDAILENVKGRIDSMSRSVDLLEGRIDAAEHRVFSDIGSKVSNLEKSIEDLSQEIQSSREQSLLQTQDDISNLAEKISSLKTTLTELESSVFDDMKQQSSEIRKEISDSLAEFYRTKDTIIEKVNSDIDKVYYKMRNVG